MAGIPPPLGASSYKFLLLNVLVSSWRTHLDLTLFRQTPNTSIKLLRLHHPPARHIRRVGEEVEKGNITVILLSSSGGGTAMHGRSESSHTLMYEGRTNTNHNSCTTTNGTRHTGFATTTKSGLRTLHGITLPAHVHPASYHGLLNRHPTRQRSSKN